MFNLNNPPRKKNESNYQPFDLPGKELETIAPPVVTPEEEPVADSEAIRTEVTRILESQEVAEEESVAETPAEHKQKLHDLVTKEKEYQESLAVKADAKKPFSTGPAYHFTDLDKNKATSAPEKVENSEKDPHAVPTVEERKARQEARAEKFAKDHNILEVREELLAAEAKYKDAYRAHHGRGVLDAFKKPDPKVQEEYNAARLKWSQAISQATENAPTKREKLEGMVLLHRDATLRAATARTEARTEALSEKGKEAFRASAGWALNKAVSAGKVAFDWYSQKMQFSGKKLASLHEKVQQLRGKEFDQNDRAKWEKKYTRLSSVVTGALVGSIITGGAGNLATLPFWLTLGVKAVAGAPIGTAVGLASGRVTHALTAKDAIAVKKNKRTEAAASSDFAKSDAAYDKGNRETRAAKVHAAQMAGAVVTGRLVGMGVGMEMHSIFSELDSVKGAIAAISGGPGPHEVLPGSAMNHSPAHAPTEKAHLDPHGQFPQETATAKHGEGAYRLFHDLQKQLVHDHNQSELAKYLIDKDPKKFMDGLKAFDPKTGHSMVVPEGAKLSLDESGQLVFHLGHGHDATVLITKTPGGDFTTTGAKFDSIKGLQFRPTHHHLTSHVDAHQAAEHPTAAPVAHEAAPSAAATPETSTPAATPEDPTSKIMQDEVSIAKTVEQPTTAAHTETSTAPSSSEAAPTTHAPEAAAPVEVPTVAQGTPIEHVMHAGSWEAYKSGPAQLAFETPVTNGNAGDVAFRGDLIQVMRTSGVGPHADESIEQYISRATAQLGSKGSNPVHIVQTPDYNFVVQGGDMDAKLTLAREFMRQQTAQHTDRVVLVPNPSAANPSYIVLSGKPSASGMQGVAQINTVPLSSVKLTPETNRIVF